MTRSERAARQGARAVVQEAPSEASLWALAQSNDLDETGRGGLS